MELLVKRNHSTEEIKERMLKITEEDLERARKNGHKIMTTRRISRLKNSIQESFEETKRSGELTDLIRQQDFSTLKQLDALMRGSHENSMISVDNLSISAVNLYVALVKRVYLKTFKKCHQEYQFDELSSITKGWTSFSEQLTTSPSKKAKLDIAEQAMFILQTTNNKAASRIAEEKTNIKTKVLAN